MRNPNAIRDHVREGSLFSGRAAVALVMVALLAMVLFGRLIFLQVFGHEHFATLSQNNRVNIQSIPPTRGLIYDRDGVVLAENIPTFSLELIPERIDDLDATLERLRDIVPFDDNDLERFRNDLERKRQFQSVPIRFRLSDREVARFSVNRHRFRGVEIEARLSRHYPLGELTAHAVGYVGRISESDLRRLDAANYSGTTHVGKVGLERAYEKQLHGQVGYQQVETNAQGRVLRVLERTPPEPGNNLHLSLDADLQRVAQSAFGEERGALVAIEPATGDVLSLVSTPGYDPNLFINGIDPDTYRALRDSPDRPLFNRAISGRYPPGSTVKPFVGLAGLELGTFDEHDHVACKGYYEPEFKDERIYRDWKEEGHGETNLGKAIAESCDVYFYEMSYRLGIDRLAPFMRKFGFGRRTGVDMGGELPGLMPTREWKEKRYNILWFPGETLITGIGQGYTLATPIQLAEATATLANGGHRMRPRLVGGVEHAGNGEMTEHAPEELERIDLDPAHLRHVVHAMEEVIHGRHGTARSIGWRIRYRMAAKTGTAQVFGIAEGEEYVEEELDKRLRDHALFIAFAPADDPRIAVGVIVENGGSGGAVAGPIAEAVISHYLEDNPP